MATMQHQETRGQQGARGSESTSQSQQGQAGQQSTSSAMTRGSGTQGQPIQRRQREPYIASPLMDPYRFMRRFFSDVDRMFDDYGMGRTFGPSLSEPTGGLAGGRLWSPSIEIFERGQSLVVRADLPGLSRDDVHCEVDGDMLVISGERRDEREEGRGEYYHSERVYGSFRRSIQLPQEVDPNAVEARFENGVLEVVITMPKRQSRNVEIRGGGAGQQALDQSTSSQGQIAQGNGGGASGTSGGSKASSATGSESKSGSSSGSRSS